VVVPYLLMVRSVRGYLASVRKDADTIIRLLAGNELPGSVPAVGA